MPSSPTEILLPNRPSAAPRPAAVTDGEHHSLLVALAAVPDPRDPRGTRYPLVSMLAVAAGDRHRWEGRTRRPASRRTPGPPAVGLRHCRRGRAGTDADRGEVQRT